MPICTDVLDKTADAAVALVGYGLVELLKKPGMGIIWQRAKHITSFADVGKHFRSEVFLNYALFDIVKQFRKTHLLQFFIGGHGKTGQLDGTVFGSPGVGGEMVELVKKEQLKTTAQLVKFCAERIIRRQLTKSTEEKLANQWLHLHWKPTSFPQKLMHMHQKYIQSLFCWEAVPMEGYEGFHPIKTWCHGIVYGSETKVPMKLVTTTRKVGEYKLVKRYPGWPKLQRTAWRMANETVVNDPPVDTRTLGQQRALTTALMSESQFLPEAKTSLTMIVSPRRKPGRKRARPDDEKCTVKKHYTDAQIAQNKCHWNGLYNALKAEAKAHGVSQTGAIKDVLMTLRTHYAKPHVDTARRSQSMSIASYFKPRDKP